MVYVLIVLMGGGLSSGTVFKVGHYKSEESVFKTRIAADRHCIRCNADWERYRASMRRRA